MVLASSPAPSASGESARLRAKLELVLPGLLAAGRRLFAHPQVEVLYPRYLMMTHGVIRASVPLMETARERALALPGDPVAADLVVYLEEHIEEERGHDDWLLEDLAVLGVDPDELRLHAPSPTVAALVGAQYYWIKHAHPVALLGYVLLLEGYPPRAGDVVRLRSRTGYPESAFRTLRLHADLDPHHGAELDALLDRLPLAERQRTLLGVSAMTSVQRLTEAVQEVLDSAARAGG